MIREQDYPHLTVAAVVCREQRFLLVEERVDGACVLNQPAGHVEPGETLVQALRRETLEETGWDIEPTALLGCALYTAPANGVSYCRVAFAARALDRRHATPPDPEIIACHWLSAAEIRAQSDRMRSPMVVSTLQRYLAGRTFPLDFLF